MTPLPVRRAALLLALPLALAACGGDDAGAPATDDSAEPERGGTAVLVEGADISTPVPLLAASAFDGNLASDVMNMELVRGVWRDGRLEYMTAEESPMAMARRYERVGPDSASLRFHMRSDLRWSDGEPITADDVVFTYELLKKPELGSPNQDYVEQLDSIVAENDSTVTFHYARRYPEMVTHAALAPLPEHVFGGADPAGLRSHPRIVNPGNGNLVTSGPWMIGQHEAGQRVVLTHNPYFEPKPYLDQIVFRVIPETTTRLVELQTGNVDMVTALPIDQIPTLEAQSSVDLRFEREQRRYYDFVAYNPKAHPAFADPEIRRALGLAIDVPGLLRAMQMEAYAEPAGGPYSPIFADLYDPQATPPLGHDPDEARRILDAKGWRDADGDGIRERGGRPLQFTLLTNSGNARRADATQIIQQQWRRVGVDARLQQQEFNTMFERMRNQEYEAVLAGWSVSLSPDLTPLWGEGSPFNITGYANAEVRGLEQRALEQPTPEAAAPIWKRVAQRLAADQPYTWLYYFDQVDAVNERLRGTRIDTYGPYQNTWEWWIPRSLRRGASAPAS